jgi:competence protein ComEC
VVSCWFKVPLMLIAFFMGIIAGVAVQLQQAVLWDATWYLACGLVGLGGLASLARLTTARLWMSHRSLGFAGRLIVLLCAAALAFGLTGWRSTHYLQTSLNPALEGVDLEVTGVVSAMPQRLDTGLRFRFEVASAHLAGTPTVLPPRLLLSWYRRAFSSSDVSAGGNAAESVAPFGLEDASITPKAGERWQFTVRLKAPHGNSNPHGFDYELWAWEQGAQGVGYVRENKRQMPPKRLGVSDGGLFSSLGFGMERARQAVRDAVFNRLTAASDRAAAGVIAALVTGDQNAIERADWDIYRATGTAHLMSISGLHITMFAWLAALLIGRLWRATARAPTRWMAQLCLHLPAAHAALLGGLALAVLYAWFSGWGVPAQRTIWMLATISFLRLVGLRWPWYATWLLAAVVVLTVDPWAMLSAGFWLSFVAVAVLFASDPTTARPEVSEGAGAQEKISIKVWMLLREQWIITLALAPLTLLLFQQVSLVGLLANAIAIPLVTFVVTPLAMLGAVFEPLWPVAASCVGYLALALKWLAAVPYAVYTAPAPPLILSCFAVLGSVLLVIPLASKKRLQALALAALLIAPALVWQPTRPAAGQFELMALDIGQGNALLIRTATHSLLYDAGPRFSRESDAGHRTVVPLLRALGERLDVLVLSHRDSDHTGGAKAVLAAQPQARVITSALLPKDRMDIGLAADKPLEICLAGQSWVWDGVRFEVLHPLQTALDAAAAGESTIKPNSLSCVLKITSGDAVNSKSALLVGDIEAPQELSLLTMQTTLQLESTLLLVPHHGSKTSSSEPFLDAVKPSIAMVQAGYRNRFAHPRPEVMARYEERKIQTVLSPQCGAATWRSEAPALVICQRDVRRRYWMHGMKGFDRLSPNGVSQSAD